jgi:hypothetical protein
VLDRANQIDERTSKPVDGPRHHDIKIPPAGVFQHLVKVGALDTPFGSADASIPVDFHNFPAAALRDPPQFRNLVLYRLSVGADPHIDRRSFDLPGHARLSQ